MTLFGVDVSSANGPIDFVKAATVINFAIMRCVQENGSVDPSFRHNFIAAKQAGLIPGAYIFLSRNTAREQLAAFIGEIKAVGGPSGMLLGLDIERPGAHPAPGDADVAIAVAAFKLAFPGHLFLQYGSRYTQLGASSKASYGPLWLSDYGLNLPGQAKFIYGLRGGDGAKQWKSPFNGWAGATIWQFGSRTRVPGFPHAVDVNAFRGTLDELHQLAGVTPPPKPPVIVPPKPPAPPPAPAKVHVGPGSWWSYSVADPKTAPQGITRDSRHTTGFSATYGPILGGPKGLLWGHSIRKLVQLTSGSYAKRWVDLNDTNVKTT